VGKIVSCEKHPEADRCEAAGSLCMCVHMYACVSTCMHAGRLVGHADRWGRVDRRTAGWFA